MAKTIARYATSFGLSGCYLPDSHGGPIICSTRRELAEAIRAEIDASEFPKATFGQANIRRLWRLICNAGSASSYHFSIQHGAYEIGFHGLTEAEAQQMEAEQF